MKAGAKCLPEKRKQTRCIVKQHTENIFAAMKIDGACLKGRTQTNITSAGK